jgi:hypothetical protein
MKVISEPARAWRTDMTMADRARVVLAWGFVFGAASHIGWLIWHGSLLYHGPAPEWAVWFWYGLCVVDLVVFWLLLARPKAGIILGCLTMATTLSVNWTQFPTFEFQFNYVLIGLTTFGVIVWAAAPGLWTGARWRLTASTGRNGD